MEFETSENTDLERVRASHDIKRASCETPDHLEEVGSTSPDRGMADDGIWDNESPHSPRNWPRWKRNTQILMASFHSMMGPFMSAGIIPVYDIFVEEYNVTKPTASYLTSFQVFVVKAYCYDAPAHLRKTHLDIAPWHIPLNMEPYNRRLRPLSRHSTIGPGKHGLQHWWRSMRVLWCTDGHSCAHGLPDLSSNWQWQRLGNRAM